MKKVVTLFLVIILFASCDSPAGYDYYIINDCKEKINVSLIDSKNKSFTYSIGTGEKQLVYHYESINFLEDYMVERWIKEITITKDDTTSKVNYIDRKLWRFEPTSKKHANSYLTVKPEDFEEKQSSGNRR